MNKTLPTELTYMQHFVDYLEGIDPEEIDESVDINLLNLAIKQRVKGLSIAKAKKLLMEDKTILDEWLENSEHVALFISAYIDVSDEFIKIVRKTKIVNTNKKTANKGVKFTATTPDGFEVDKFKNALLFTKTEQSSSCAIDISIPNEKELHSLRLIEEHVNKTKLTNSNIEVYYFEWCEQDTYQFILDNINFMISVQSFNYELDKKIILYIINSIEIIN